MSPVRRLGGRRRGTVSVLSAFLLVVMLTMAAFAIDIGNLCRVETEAQAVADAAALAGARGLPSGSSTAQTDAINCAALNKANSHAVSLTTSNVVTGTWNPTAGTFTATTTNPNAVQVRVPLTSANGNPVSMFFAKVLGISSANVNASATACAGRWDVVVVIDRSGSFEQDLSTAASGIQNVLTSLNQYSPSSYMGVVSFGGVAYTNASMQQVGTNYSALQSAINGIVDCSDGGPPCSGSDLAAGMAAGIALFSSPGYSPPAGTRQAVIFVSDGAASITSKSDPNYGLSDTQDNTLAATEASNAWTNNGISVFSVLYYHGSDTQTDVNAMQALAQGQGTFINEPTATDLPTDLQSIIVNNLSMALVK